MAEVAIEKAPQKVRDMFNRGFAAFERGNLDYALEMFGSCLEIEPGLLKVRRYLLAALLQKRKNAKGGALAPMIAQVKGLPKMVTTMAMLKGKKAAKALAGAEALLRFDPLNAKFAELFTDAALMNDLPEAAQMVLETVREQKADNIPLLRRLADVYEVLGNTEAVRNLYEHLNTIKPNDPELVKAYKDAMARHSISRDGWQQAADAGGSFRNAMKDSQEAVQLEREAKAVKTDRDAESLIADTLVKLEGDPENVNHYRALARLYAQIFHFEDAIATLEEALRRSPGDPELDQMLSGVRLQQMDHEIKTLRDAGDEEAAQQREQERKQFHASDLEDRMRRYPNDLRVRYEYGVALYQGDRINDAIQQFQASQRSPKHRTRSLYYLALCFKTKQQYDMAAQSLTAAASEIPVLDGTKKDILYELGTLHELMGKPQEAVGYFKEIYQVDIGYRDVAEKVEKLYSA